MTTITASLVTCAGFICVGGGTPAHFMDRAAAMVAETKTKENPMTNEPADFGALPPVPDHPESCIADHWSPYELSAISAYGHACAEAARAPLAEENARLQARLRSVCQTLVEAVGAEGPCNAEDAAVRAVARIAELERVLENKSTVLKHIYDSIGTAFGLPVNDAGDALFVVRNAAKFCAERDRLRADLAAKAGEVEALRAASVIEWEPGRSYTAADLLRRAIRGIRGRKSRSICPAVENLFGCGNTVARHLCRWAGRDPDTGKDIAARKGEAVQGEGNASDNV